MSQLGGQETPAPLMYISYDLILNACHFILFLESYIYHKNPALETRIPKQAHDDESRAERLETLAGMTRRFPLYFIMG